MTTATLDQDQRDAGVLWLCDDHLGFHPEEAARVAALADDLILADAEGRYRVARALPRRGEARLGALLPWVGK